MPQQELLKRVVEALDRAGSQYAITGSWASSIHGEPRSTHDIDMIVAVKVEAIPILVGEFPEPDYVLQEQMIRDAIRTGGMFTCSGSLRVRKLTSGC